MRSCGHDKIQKEFRERFPEAAAKQRALFEKASRVVQQSLQTHKRMEENLIRIPVVWHVLFDTSVPATRVTREQIEQEMTWLNDWFSAKNRHYSTRSDFFADSIAVEADFKIQFELAAFDNNGNPFDGIEYFETPTALDCDENNVYFPEKGGVAIWDPLEFMNIYTCSTYVLGFAYLPESETHPQDGLVHNYLELGDTFYSGSTIAHETGHFLGLLHTFEECGAPGDYVDDTPSSDMDSFTAFNGGCPGGGDPDSDFVVCDNIVMVQNTMDYNFEYCLCYFSKGQVARMRFFLTDESSSRKNLRFSPALGCETYDCTGKNCGDDGCGSVCGNCFGTAFCNENQICESVVPDNLECSSAEILQVDETTRTLLGDTTEANVAIEVCADTVLDKPLWYTFTATSNQRLVVDTIGSSLDTTLTLVSSSDCSTFECIANNDDISEGNLASQVDTCMIIGTTYFVIVDGNGAKFGSFQLNYKSIPEAKCCTPDCTDKTCGDDGCGGNCGICFENEICESQQCASASNNNDNCVSALTINESVSSQNNLGASFDDISCSGIQTLSVWYRYQGLGNTVTVDTCTNDFDTVLHIFSGVCNNLSCEISNDDGCPSGFGSSVTFCGDSNTNYYFSVDGYNGRVGTFDLAISTGNSCNAPKTKETGFPAIAGDSAISVRSVVSPREILAVNEECSTATNLDLLGFPTANVILVDSTKLSDTPIAFACIASRAKGLWYRFTGTGRMVRIDTCTETADPYESIIQVISGSCDNSQCEAYALSGNSPLCGNGGETVICTTIGQTYFILVEGNFAEGEFVLDVQDTQTECRIPTNTPCSNAQVITPGNTESIVHKDYKPSIITDCATISSPDGSTKLTNAAWFTFDANVSAMFNIDLCSDNRIGSFSIEVYEGSSCSTARCFGNSETGTACNNGVSTQNTKNFCTTAGTKYFFVVYGDYGRYDLTLNNVGSCTVTCNPVCPVSANCGDDTCGGSCGLCSGTCENFVCFSATPVPSVPSPVITVSVPSPATTVSVASPITTISSPPSPSLVSPPPSASSAPRSNSPSISAVGNAQTPPNSPTRTATSSPELEDVDTNSFSSQSSFTSFSSSFSSRFTSSDRSSTSTGSILAWCISTMIVGFVALAFVQ